MWFLLHSSSSWSSYKLSWRDRANLYLLDLQLDVVKLVDQLPLLFFKHLCAFPGSVDIVNNPIALFLEVLNVGQGGVNFYFVQPNFAIDFDAFFREFGLTLKRISERVVQSLRISQLPFSTKPSTPISPIKKYEDSSKLQLEISPRIWL